MQIGPNRLQKQRVDHAAANSDALVGLAMTICLIHRLWTGVVTHLCCGVQSWEDGATSLGIQGRGHPKS